MGKHTLALVVVALTVGAPLAADDAANIRDHYRKAAAAYQAKDYGQAHQLSYQAYQQMFDLAGQLSHAIGVTLGAKLPKGGSQTGGGGMAAVVSRR